VTARRIAVIGASLSGLRTVEALRRLGCDARITLVGDETALPYDRPPLSKDVLLGKLGAVDVALATRTALDDLDIDLRLGTRATGLDLATRTVSTTTGTVAFDELVIATGARARRPGFLPDLDGIHTLRTIDDALAVRAAFEAGARVVVLGGGFIGCEVASAARDLGLDVSVVDVAPVLMGRGLGPVVGERMGEVARRAGVGLHLGTSVVDVLGTDRVEAVLLADGTVLPADLLVVGVGAVPNTEWLEGAGVVLDDGVVCDEFLAAAPGVHAVGDVARWRHPHYDRALRCEHWTTAGEHADAVAATLTGTPTAASAIPYVWSDQFGHKLQVAGVLGTADETRFLVDDGSDDGPQKFVAVTGSRGVQSAAFALDAPGALVRQRMKLAASPPWPPEMG